MRKYTLESLKQLNILYDRRYTLTESDVVAVNEFVDLIEERRHLKVPIIGNIVKYRKRVGEPYELAHIERIKGKFLYICEDPDPYLITINLFGKLTSQTMTKNLYRIQNKLKLIRKETKAFYIMGYEGQWRTNKIKFYSDVNLWEHCEV